MFLCLSSRFLVKSFSLGQNFTVGFPLVSSASPRPPHHSPSVDTHSLCASSLKEMSSRDRPLPSSTFLSALTFPTLHSCFTVNFLESWEFVHSACFLTFHFKLRPPAVRQGTILTPSLKSLLIAGFNYCIIHFSQGRLPIVANQPKQFMIHLSRRHFSAHVTNLYRCSGGQVSSSPSGHSGTDCFHLWLPHAVRPGTPPSPHIPLVRSCHI